MAIIDRVRRPIRLPSFMRTNRPFRKPHPEVSLSKDERALAAAVKLLDDYRPSWRSMINVRELDMADGRCCVLGQVFGSYRRGAIILEEEFDSERARTADRAFGVTFPKQLWVQELTR